MILMSAGRAHPALGRPRPLTFAPRG